MGALRRSPIPLIPPIPTPFRFLRTLHLPAGYAPDWRIQSFTAISSNVILLPNRYTMYTRLETNWKSLLVMCGTKQCHPRGPNHNLVASDLRTFS